MIPLPINYNMRCIETCYLPVSIAGDYKINYNMRCIETKSDSKQISMAGDKLQHEMYWNDNGNMYKKRLDKINYNMRCIETFQ